MNHVNTIPWPLEHPIHLMAVLLVLTGQIDKDTPLGPDIRVEGSPLGQVVERTADELARRAQVWTVEHDGCRDHPGKLPEMVIFDSVEAARSMCREVGIPDHLMDHDAYLVWRALRSALVLKIVTQGYVPARQELLDAVSAVWAMDAAQADR